MSWALVDRNALDNDGNTPAMLAALGGKLDVLHLLLARGAKDIPNRQGLTLTAVQYGGAVAVFTRFRQLQQVRLCYVGCLFHLLAQVTKAATAGDVGGVAKLRSEMKEADLLSGTKASPSLRFLRWSQAHSSWQKTVCVTSPSCYWALAPDLIVSFRTPRLYIIQVQLRFWSLAFLFSSAKSQCCHRIRTSTAVDVCFFGSRGSMRAAAGG